MKKIIALIAALCLLLTASAMAGCPEDFFEVNDRVLNVRTPEGALDTVFDGTAVPETLAEGEVVDGILSVSYMLPESALGQPQLFTVYLFPTDDSRPVSFSQTYESDESGILTPVSFEVLDGDALIQWSEYQPGEGKKISVSLVGNPSTGYVWNWIPDNSGMFELDENFAESLTEDEEDIVGAPEADYFIFSLNANAPGTDGFLLFEYARADGDPARSVMVSVRTDGLGEVVSVEPLFMEGE